MSLPDPLPTWRDRWSGRPGGTVVLDLGEQPPSDLFPLPDDPRPDPVFRLRLVQSAVSGLVQLEDDPTTPEEVLGVEPVALVRQAEQCVADAATAGFVAPGARALEYPSPHGGSWTTQLTERGVVVVDDGEVDLVVDVHGMMHDADQKAALLERVGHLAPDGVLLMMIHNVTSIVRAGMWNAAKNGHFAYYSTPVLVRMAQEVGLEAVGAWEYPLYQDGTTLLAFARQGSRWGGQSDDVTRVVEKEVAEGVLDPLRVATLGEALETTTARIRAYLDEARAAGLRVAGYGAASRTAALLCSADVTPEDVVVVADAATGKHGRCMPGSRIPIASPQDLALARPDRVLLFVPDLLPEVRAALPEVEQNGGRWVVMDPSPREVDPVG
ncbi:MULTISPECIES: hypothetical protein [Cellulosimicrobium]|uniref:C-methyltransferase domain-containing protein n=1 Tax=Cellulosimicrobium cellulans F16 TaxID=1350482 RepID=A0A0M0F9G4_CELCE|nr:MULTISPECIES: hypothetical protein [Cellulosimicrobium]KON74103.1 hypothetical protein M768_08335 [Cellulosimicrobium cellulans F16]KZM79383.1 hypothetical protein A0J59_09600 [Cellulosimicrobium sp. I38E]